MENPEKQIKNLLSTGLLDDVVSPFETRAKKTTNRIFRVSTALLIISFQKILEDSRNFKDPARKYIKKLQDDIKHLTNTQTHAGLISPIQNLMEIKLTVGRCYCELFRKRPKKDYLLDLFFVFLDDHLKHMEYKQRIETLTKVFLLFQNPSNEHVKWENMPIEKWDRASSSVEKRLHRASNRFSKSLKNREAKKFETARLDWLNSQSPDNLKKEPDPYWATKRGVKRGVRNAFLKKALSDKIQSQREPFIKLDQEKLRFTIKKLKLPNQQKTIRLLLSDKEFVQAFNSLP